MTSAAELAKATADAPHPGALLREARERHGASAKDVASALRLDVSVIEAIEDGRHDDLPAPAYVRGYVRSYAQLLRIDADKVTARFMALGGDHPAPPKKRVWVGPAATDTQSIRRTGLRYTIVVVVLLGLAAGILWVASRYADLPLLTSTPFDGSDAPQQPAATTEPTPSPIEENRLDAGAASGPAPATADFDASAATAAGEEGELAASEEDALADPEQSPPSATDQPSATDALVVVDELVIDFVADSWVRVVDATGAERHADLGRPEDSVRVTGQAPFEVRVGYAPGVQMTFNGDPVVLEPHTNDNNVANLLLVN